MSPATASPAPAASATACASPTPTLAEPFARANGSLDIGAPFILGRVLLYLNVCRDMVSVGRTYGLGAAALVPIGTNADPAGRYYRVAVPVGEEAATVTRLVAHPEDFQYVILEYIPIGGAPEATFVRQSSIKPTEGPAGTSFAMQICCWDVGTLVTKIFTTPRGRTIAIADVVRADRTVPGGWGGSPDDERGTYTVFVRDDAMTVGSLVHFRVF